MQVDNMERVELNLDSSSFESKPIDNEEVNRKIKETLQEILDETHTSRNKKTIKTYNDRYTFACVYCGDSGTDDNKKRANLFLNNNYYHCFRATCGKHISMYAFFKNKNKLNNFSRDEISHLKHSSKTHEFDAKAIKHFKGMEVLVSEDLMKLMIDRDVFMNKKELVEIKGSRIESYLKQRGQTDFDKLAFNPKNGNVYIFNLSSQKDKIISYQVKTFNKQFPYLTYKTTRMYKELGIPTDGLEEALDKLDVLSQAFGIFHLDMNRMVTIFEGPFDSFLFPNATATISANNDFPFDIENKRYFYDNDAAGYKKALLRIQEGYPVFLWKKYLKDHEPYLNVSLKIKDLTDLIGLAKSKNIKLKPFSKYFSEDKYDAIWI